MLYSAVTRHFLDLKTCPPSALTVVLVVIMQREHMPPCLDVDKWLMDGSTGLGPGQTYPATACPRAR